MPSPRAEQPLAVRITHWANVPLLAIMAASGLQILAAFPEMGPKGAPAGWYPLQGWTPPAWMRAGDWLAGAFHLLGLAALLVFTVGHVVLVLLHPRALASIFTGGRRA